MTRRRRAIAYTLILIPAAAGAVLDAPWPVTLAAVGVAMFFATRAHVLVAPREVRQDFAKNLVLACCTIAVGVIAAQIASPRYFGLVVAGWGVVSDVVWRAWPERLGVHPSPK